MGRVVGPTERGDQGQRPEVIRLEKRQSEGDEAAHRETEQVLIDLFAAELLIDEPVMVDIVLGKRFGRFKHAMPALAVAETFLIDAHEVIALLREKLA